MAECQKDDRDRKYVKGSWKTSKLCLFAIMSLVLLCVPVFFFESNQLMAKKLPSLLLPLSFRNADGSYHTVSLDYLSPGSDWLNETLYKRLRYLRTSPTQYMKIAQRKLNSLHFSSETQQELLNRSVLVVIDMWDSHWCPYLDEQGARLTCPVNRLTGAMRERGVPIVHLASNVVDYYEGTRPYQKAVDMRRHYRERPPISEKMKEAVMALRMPIKEVCAAKVSAHVTWTRLHKDIVIDQDDDMVTEKLEPILGLLEYTGRDILIFAGQHLDRCVVRSRAASAMWQVARGIKSVVIREAVAPVYDPSFARWAKEGVMDVVDAILGTIYYHAGVGIMALEESLPSVYREMEGYCDWPAGEKRQ